MSEALGRSIQIVGELMLALSEAERERDELRVQLEAVRAALECADLRLADLGDTHAGLARRAIRDALAQIGENKR